MTKSALTYQKRHKTLRPISCSANNSALLEGGSHVNGGDLCPLPEHTWEHTDHRTGPPHVRQQGQRQMAMGGASGSGMRRGLPATKEPSGSTVFRCFLLPLPPAISASEATSCSGPIAALGPHPTRPHTLPPPQRGATHLVIFPTNKLQFHRQKKGTGVRIRCCL